MAVSTLKEAAFLESFSSRNMLKEFYVSSRPRNSFREVVASEYGMDVFVNLFCTKKFAIFEKNLHFCYRRHFEIFSDKFVKDKFVPENLKFEKSATNGANLNTSDIVELNHFFGAKRVAETIKSFGEHSELCSEKLHFLGLATESKSSIVTIVEELFNLVLNAHDETELLIYVRLATHLFENHFVLETVRDGVGQLNSFLFDSSEILSWTELRNVLTFFAQVQSGSGVAFEFYPKRLFERLAPPPASQGNNDSFGDLFKEASANQTTLQSADLSCEEQFLSEYLSQISLMLEDPQTIMANVSKPELLEYLPLSQKFVVENSFLNENSGRKLQFGFVEDFVSARDQKRSFLEWALENQDLHEDPSELFKLFVFAFFSRATKSLTHAKTFTKRHRPSLEAFFRFDFAKKTEHYSRLLTSKKRHILFPFQRAPLQTTSEASPHEDGGVLQIEISNNDEAKLALFPVYESEQLANMDTFVRILFQGCANSPLSILLCCRIFWKNQILPLDVIVRHALVWLFNPKIAYRSVFLALLKTLKAEIVLDIAQKQRYLKKKIKEQRKLEKKEKKTNTTDGPKHNKLVKFSTIKSYELKFLDAKNPLLGLSYEQTLHKFHFSVFELLFYYKIVWATLVVFVHQNRGILSCKQSIFVTESQARRGALEIPQVKHFTRQFGSGQNPKGVRGHSEYIC